MTFERFKQLWIDAGLDKLPKVEKPLMVDSMSNHTIDALIAASRGDFTAFDEIEHLLSKNQL